MQQRIFTTLAVLLGGLVFVSGAFAGAEGEAAAARASSMEPGPYGKYDPPIDVTFINHVNDSFHKTVTLNDQTLEDNMWNDQYRERFGINVKYLWIAKSAEEYQQKLNLSMASGDIPDILELDHQKPPVNVARLYEAGRLQPLNAVYPAYASERVINDVYQHEPEATFKSVTFDGQLYALPRVWEFAGEGRAVFIWARQDWMQNLNLSAPQTFDEVIDMARAFTFDDPDQNGKDDTYGLLMQRRLFYGGVADATLLFNAYHAYPDIWIEKDGKLVYGSVQPEMKQPLALMRQLYAEGIIDQEFGTRVGDKLPEEVISGRVGMEFGAQWNPLWPLLDTVRDAPEVDWLPLMVPSSDDRTVRFSSTVGHSGYFAVNNEFAYPEALMKILNGYWDMYALESSTMAYPPSKEGGTWQAWLLSPIDVNKPGMNFNTQLTISTAYHENISIQEAMKKHGHEFGEVVDMYNFVVSYLGGKREDWGWARIFMPGKPGEVSQAGMHQLIEQGRFLPEAFLGVPSETMTTKWPTLTSLQEETLIKIIIGDLELDAFDEFVQQWHDLGGTEITEDVNEWFSSQ